MDRKLASFRIDIFKQEGSEKPIVTYEGTGKEWREFLSIRVTTEFDYANADLTETWKGLFASKECKFSQNVEFLECIVKWGDTMLMRWPYYVAIKVTYKDSPCT
ncbi:hypothetical protein P7F88_08175 [Vibrio hannami]|uniref:hypothetical protein n=1 Tax=Vibrio hannami TaxID=2717094 RepID=UPI00240F062D|nr:hypothetical protein [Vibrio hannami]MDG3086074.1 hypothetical protein [Vibrio hannami]